MKVQKCNFKKFIFCPREQNTLRSWRDKGIRENGPKPKMQDSIVQRKKPQIYRKTEKMKAEIAFLSSGNLGKSLF